MDISTPKRFDKAFAALVAAFFNNTLMKSNCTACAIGNITADACGVSLRISPSNGYGIEVCNEDHLRLLTEARRSRVPIQAEATQTQIEALGTEHSDVLHHSNWRYLFFTALDENGNLLQMNYTDGLGMVTGLINKMLTPEQYMQARFVIGKTGYEPTQLAKVEFAFEEATKIPGLEYPKHTLDEIKADQYNGLVACTKVLCEIDGIDPTDYIKTLEYSVDPNFHAAHPELVEEAYDLATV